MELDLIRTDAGTQARAAIDEATVAEYAEAMRSGDTFPPVVVFHDGAGYFLADGFHRVMAARRIGAKTVDADIRKGTRTDALMFALGANTKHGLRRTNADKQHCIRTALREWPSWSDRRIAKVCGVDHKTVGSVRRGGELPHQASDSVILLERSVQILVQAETLLQNEIEKEIEDGTVPLGSGILVERAGKLLAEANMIQKKELEDDTLTLADWVRRKNLAEEGARHAASYSLRVERRLGEILKEMEGAKVKVSEQLAQEA